MRPDGEKQGAGAPSEMEVKEPLMKPRITVEQHRGPLPTEGVVQVVRRPSRSTARRGAVALETALIMLVFLTLILGMLDLGIAIFRHHNLAQAARQGARQAIVHGSLADELGVWGPGRFSGRADDAAGISAAIRPSLVNLDLSDVSIDVEWLDGGNNGMYGDRVRVAVATPYQPIMTYIFGNPTFTLRAESTMAIQH